MIMPPSFLDSPLKTGTVQEMKREGVELMMTHYVGSVGDLPADQALIVEVEGVSIGIFHQDGQVYAVRNTCPHKQAPICKGTVGGTMLPSEPCEFQFGLEGQVLKCPWHGWEFDLRTGQSLFGISNRKVKTYPVEVKGGKIYITI